MSRAEQTIGRLAAVGIFTAREFAEMGEADAWISVHALCPFYAVLYAGEPGRWSEHVINSDERTAFDLAIGNLVEAAIGKSPHPRTADWVQGPFRWSWQTRSAHEKVMKYLERRESER